MGAWTRRGIAVLAVLVAAAWAAAAQETQTFDAAGLRVLRIKNPTGDIAVTAQQTAQVSVWFRKPDFATACTLSMQRMGEVLVIAVDKLAGSQDACGMDLEIHAPREISVDATSGSGNLDVQAIAGKLTFKLGSGDITARGAFTEVTGTSGSGDVKVTGLVGNGGVRAGSGDVWIDFMTAPPPGALKVRAGSGDVEVRMPTGTKVSTRLVAGSGRVRNDLGNDPNAEYFVSVQAGSGNVRLTSN